MKNFEVIKNLKDLTYFLVFLGSSVLMFDLCFYLMKNLAGERDLMCVVGGNLTAGNIAFAIVFSFLFGMMVANIFALFRNKSFSIKSNSVGGFAAFLGTFTMFCTVCTFQVVSIFGFSVGLGFFTTFSPFLQFLSLVLMFFALKKINDQLLENCSCRV